MPHLNFPNFSDTAEALANRPESHPAVSEKGPLSTGLRVLPIFIFILIKCYESIETIKFKTILYIYHTVPYNVEKDKM